MTTNDDMPEMVTLQEAANRLKAANIPIGYQLLRRLCSQGKLNCCRIGRIYLLNWSDFIHYLETGGDEIR